MNKLEEIKSLIDEYDKRVTEEWKSGAEFPMNALKHLLFERRENIIELIEAAKKLLDAKTALSTNTAKPRLRLAVKPFTEEKE